MPSFPRSRSSLLPSPHAVWVRTLFPGRPAPALSAGEPPKQGGVHPWTPNVLEQWLQTAVDWGALWGGERPGEGREGCRGFHGGPRLAAPPPPGTGSSAPLWPSGRCLLRGGPVAPGHPTPAFHQSPPRGTLSLTFDLRELGPVASAESGESGPGITQGQLGGTAECCWGHQDLISQTGSTTDWHKITAPCLPPAWLTPACVWSPLGDTVLTPKNRCCQVSPAMRFLSQPPLP